jgi:hypothetical protein
MESICCTVIVGLKDRFVSLFSWLSPASCFDRCTPVHSRKDMGLGVFHIGGGMATRIGVACVMFCICRFGVWCWDGGMYRVNYRPVEK